MIEGSVAFEFAAGRAQEDDLAELEGLVEQMERACRNQEVDRWSDLNSEFHCRVAEVTTMELLLDFTRRAFDYWGRIRRFCLTEIVPDILTAQAEHHEMLRLLRQRKGKELAHLVARHNRQARDYYLSWLADKTRQAKQAHCTEK